MKALSYDGLINGVRSKSLIWEVTKVENSRGKNRRGNIGAHTHKKIQVDLRAKTNARAHVDIGEILLHYDDV